MAAKATLHCLTGCASGEILGMVIGTALLWGNVPTMALGMAFSTVAPEGLGRVVGVSCARCSTCSTCSSGPASSSWSRPAGRLAQSPRS